MNMENRRRSGDFRRLLQKVKDIFIPSGHRVHCACYLDGLVM